MPFFFVIGIRFTILDSLTDSLRKYNILNDNLVQVYWVAVIIEGDNEM
jgi:hypothetical protein